MSQLTEKDLIEKALAALSRMGCNDTFQNNFANHLKRELNPLPTWGELYNQCYWESGCDTEKAAKTFIRAFIEREVKPVVEVLIELAHAHGYCDKYVSGIENGRELIKVGE